MPSRVSSRLSSAVSKDGGQAACTGAAVEMKDCIWTIQRVEIRQITERF